VREKFYFASSGTIKSNQYDLINQSTCIYATFGLGIEQCSNWHLDPVKDLHDTYQKAALEKLSCFIAPVSGACVMGIALQTT